VSKVNGGSNVFFLNTDRQLYNIGAHILDVTDIATARQNARHKEHGTRMVTFHDTDKTFRLLTILQAVSDESTDETWRLSLLFQVVDDERTDGT
jgi:hypothetical protein